MTTGKPGLKKPASQKTGPKSVPKTAAIQARVPAAKAAAKMTRAKAAPSKPAAKPAPKKTAAKKPAAGPGKSTSPISSPFATQLVQGYRSRRQLTQEGLAQMLNDHFNRAYDKSRVSRWEKGKEKPPGDVIALMRRDVVALAPPSQSKALIIALANQKGGVGKTTSTVNLAVCLARMDLRVLLVDCDPQGSATINLGCDPGELAAEDGATLFEVLFERKTIADVMRKIEGFHLVPAAITLAEADARLMAEPGGQSVLVEKLDAVRGEFDIILLDCPPNLAMLTVNALTAANQVLIPFRPEPLDIMGIPSLLNTVRKLRSRANPDLDVFGLVPTGYTGSNVHDDMIAQVTSTYGDKVRIYPPINRSVKHAEAAAEGRPAVLARPGTPGLQVYWQIAEDIRAMVLLNQAQAAEASHGRR
jgi:chromosome partitioning protein